MIPASYLFKDVFQQSFYDHDITQAVERHRRDRNGRHILSWMRRRPTGTASAGEPSSSPAFTNV